MFRDRLRKWLRERTGDGQSSRRGARNEEALNAWHQELYKAGYIGMSLPLSAGGQGLPAAFEAIFHEEIGLAGAPSVIEVANLIHAIHRFGSDQQRNDVLPGLISGSVRWCLGRHEPGADTDIMIPTTCARRIEADGSTRFRVTGRETRMRFANGADWCLLLCRSNFDVSTNVAISALLVPMSSPGIAVVEPIGNHDGESESADVIFCGTDVPIANVLGTRDEGPSVWAQLRAYQREMSATERTGRLFRRLRDFEHDVRLGWLPDTPATLACLGRTYAELRALQTTLQRSQTCQQPNRLSVHKASVDELLMIRAGQVLRQAVMEVRASEPVETQGPEWDDYIASCGNGVGLKALQASRIMLARHLFGPGPRI